MRKSAIFPAWGRILRGYRPFLSIEITKECPLRCPGCYAYQPEHLNNGHSIRALPESRGDSLVKKVLETTDRCRPLHVSFVGGEPLLRRSELTCLIRELEVRKIEIQIVTSAVAPIPAEWKSFSNFHLTVSIDGLPPEHDIRRTPATYERILRNTIGHSFVVHCTVLPHFLHRHDYLKEFTHFWSSTPGVSKIWFSLFTPQIGEYLPERLSAQERAAAVERIAELRTLYPKVHAPDSVLRGYQNPPASPAECIFAQTTTCIASDLSTRIVPCQIGGQPDCSQCGCMASAGFAAIGRVRLAGIRLSDIFAASRKIGEWYRREEPRATPGSHRYPRPASL